jgi:N-acetylmuramic acid 6-phosphate etherase
MISTSVMIQLGRVEDNKMVNMQLTNDKIVDRGVKMLMQKIQLEDYEAAKKLLLENGTVKKAMEAYQK